MVEGGGWKVNTAGERSGRVTRSGESPVHDACGPAGEWAGIDADSSTFHLPPSTRRLRGCPLQAAPSALARGCVVIPAYREARFIGDLVRRVRSVIPDVFVVDDGSPDATASAAGAAGATVLRHPVNRGKGAALETGLAQARAGGFAFVVTMDGDGQHDPAELARFLQAYRDGGAPVLVGNRFHDLARMPWLRRATNRAMSWLLSREMGQRVPDTQCGYRLFGREVLPWLSGGAATRYAAESEVLLRLARRGVRIGCVPVTAIYGDERSKINPLSDTVRFLRMLLRFHRQSRRRTAEGLL